MFRPCAATDWWPWGQTRLVYCAQGSPVMAQGGAGLYSAYRPSAPLNVHICECAGGSLSRRGLHQPAARPDDHSDPGDGRRGSQGRVGGHRGRCGRAGQHLDRRTARRRGILFLEKVAGAVEEGRDLGVRAVAEGVMAGVRSMGLTLSGATVRRRAAQLHVRRRRVGAGYRALRLALKRPRENGRCRRTGARRWNWSPTTLDAARRCLF